MRIDGFLLLRQLVVNAVLGLGALRIGFAEHTTQHVAERDSRRLLDLRLDARHQDRVGRRNRAVLHE